MYDFCSFIFGVDNYICVQLDALITYTVGYLYSGLPIQMFCIGDNKEPVSTINLLVDNVNTFVSFPPPPVFHSRGDWYSKRILAQMVGSKIVKK